VARVFQKENLTRVLYGNACPLILKKNQKFQDNDFKIENQTYIQKVGQVLNQTSIM